jgi:GNAT superfamily N-acetyltransferase
MIDSHVARGGSGDSNESPYAIALARPADLALIPAIELAAARLLVGHAPESVLAEATNEADLDRLRREGHLWVATANNRPVGFAYVEVFEPRIAHLDEIDVHPDHGRRGLGRRLVMAVCDWAESVGFEAVTLCTFRDVPWNMPFYKKLGFDVVLDDMLSPAVASVVADEARRGLDISRRVVMRRTLTGPRSAA